MRPLRWSKALASATISENFIGMISPLGRSLCTRFTVSVQAEGHAY
jgi:hypothetical protein